MITGTEMFVDGCRPFRVNSNKMIFKPYQICFPRLQKIELKSSCMKRRTISPMTCVLAGNIEARKAAPVAHVLL
jgi:hypothetical protein